ncbi:LCP family protein [Kribbella sp. NPDC054772]
MGETLLAALVPGLGFVIGGRRRLGALVMALAAGLVGFGAYVVFVRRDLVLEWAVDPNRLLVATGVVLALAVGWIWVVVASHKLLRPLSSSVPKRLVGSAFVGLICFAIGVPSTLAVQTVMAQRDLVGSVFQSEGSSRSATRPAVNTKDPWADTPRLNILLLGADNGAGRTGTRTDTVMVASIDTHTGATKLISLSRNWMRMPFPKSSPLHRKYPDGFWDPNLGDVEQPQYYLDAMYDTIPKQYPGLLGQTDNEGADAVKLAAGAALGLDVQYYMQVNLAGFQRIVDAVGGITVNVNYPVPIGGEYGIGPGANAPKKPSGYIEPGANQHLDGYHALWFARGRYGLDDASRQERQRCTVRALVSSVSPGTLVTQYQQIAAASRQMLRTDIPQELLPAFVQLALKVKSAGVSTVNLDPNKNFPTGRNPDYAAIRKLIQQAITPHTARKPSRANPAVTPHTAQNLDDACAYHPGNRRS